MAQVKSFDSADLHLKETEVATQKTIPLQGDELREEMSLDLSADIPTQIRDFDSFDLELIAAYEKAIDVPPADTLTRWFGDLAMFVHKDGVTSKQLGMRLTSALAAIGMTREEFHNSEPQATLYSHLLPIIKNALTVAAKDGAALDELPHTTISQERIAEMEELFWNETNDPETEEWREDLTPEEEKLVDSWDDDFEQGLAKMSPASREAQVIGTLTYLDSGEVMEYTDSNEFVAAYQNDLYYMGPNSVRAKTITRDIETHYRIFEAGANEFGYEVDRDAYFQLAQQYGFDQPWPKDVMYYGTLEELAEYKERSSNLPVSQEPAIIQQIVNFLVQEGTQQTEGGSWIVPISKIEEIFGVPISPDYDFVKKLMKALFDAEEIADVTMTYDEVDMDFFLNYCPVASFEDEDFEL